MKKNTMETIITLRKQIRSMQKDLAMYEEIAEAEGGEPTVFEVDCYVHPEDIWLFDSHSYLGRETNRRGALINMAFTDGEPLVRVTFSSPYSKDKTFGFQDKGWPEDLIFLQKWAPMTRAPRFINLSLLEGKTDGDTLDWTLCYGITLRLVLKSMSSDNNTTAQRLHASIERTTFTIMQEANSEDADADAFYRFGCCFDFGLDAEHNDSIAKYWYQKAADLGNEDAKHKLAGYKACDC